MISEFGIGTTSLAQIVESAEFLLSPYEVFPDCGENHIAANIDWLLPRWYDSKTERLAITIQSFLIRTGKLNILVDTCSGNDKDRQRPFFNRRNWPWLERLREAAVSPANIDIVLCSHLHVDHVGWNTRLDNGDWVPMFPNARYLISKREWNYWRSTAKLQCNAPAITSLIAFCRSFPQVRWNLFPMFTTSRRAC